MWTNLTKVGGVTNTVTLPQDGLVSFVIPEGVDLCAYVNGAIAPMHHVHVRGGDTMYFELKSHNNLPASMEVNYNGISQTLSVMPETNGIIKGEVMGKDVTVADATEMGAVAHNLKKLNKKVDNMTPAETINLFANPGMGAGSSLGAGAGAGLGAGLLGGVLGGALLGNRGLLGGVGGVVSDGVVASAGVTPAFLASEINRVQDNTQFAVAASERLNMARFDAEANREIQAAVERTAAATQLATAVQSAALGVEIAKTGGDLNTQSALNAAALGVQIQKTAGDTQTQLATQTAALGVQNEKTAAANALAISMAIQASLQNQNAGFSNAAQQLANTQYVLSTAIKTDGDLTRAMIIANNDAELNRRLITAQNEIIELRGDARGRDRSKEVEVNVNQTVTQIQAQAQAQQQQQQQAILNTQILHALQNLQIATATNQSLIIGNTGAVVGGAQTANPVNVRA